MPGDVEFDITLEFIFEFLTGCHFIPPLGFGDDVPFIEFHHDPLPYVSTCTLKLILPYSLAIDYDEFKVKLLEAFINGPGFLKY